MSHSLFTDRQMVPPSVPRVIPLSPTEVQIEWDPIIEGLPVDSYTVQYRLVRSGSNTQWETLDGTIRGMNSYKVEGLQPGKRRLDICLLMQHSTKINKPYSILWFKHKIYVYRKFRLLRIPRGDNI